MLYLGGTVIMMRDKKTPIGRWAARLRARRPYKVAAIAVANRLARIIWALLTNGGVYDLTHGREASA